MIFLWFFVFATQGLLEVWAVWHLWGQYKCSKEVKRFREEVENAELD